MIKYLEGIFKSVVDFFETRKNKWNFMITTTFTPTVYINKVLKCTFDNFKTCLILSKNSFLSKNPVLSYLFLSNYLLTQMQVRIINNLPIWFKIFCRNSIFHYFGENAEQNFDFLLHRHIWKSRIPLISFPFLFDLCIPLKHFPYYLRTSKLRRSYFSGTFNNQFDTHDLKVWAPIKCTNQIANVSNYLN